MRFVILFMFAILTSQPAFAAPGDKLNAEFMGSDKPATKRQIRLNDAPVVPNGFKITKSVSNLGEIVSISVIENDVFVADATQDRILRLKSRNANSVFDARAEFLIGFDGIYDLATANGALFISDRSGVWKIIVGHTLVASVAPKLIFSHPKPGSNSAIALAVSPHEDTLIIGFGGKVITADTTTGKQQTIMSGPWWIQDIAVSPIGSVWAAVTQNNLTYVLPVQARAETGAKLILPPGAHVAGLQFWSKEVFPDDWPAEWASDLLFSIGGHQPMVARAHFNFGDVDPEFTAFIDGFSAPSRVVGRREFWGTPTAMGILSNGQLIFAERAQGALWVMEKDPESLPSPFVSKSTPLEPDLKEKSLAPGLLKGSSIKSASSLETDELLKAPKHERVKVED